MYYDPKPPECTAASNQSSFKIDYVVGWEAGCGSSSCTSLPLSQLYFCEACSRVVSKRDLAEDIDSYYCPNCLENMPSSEAMFYGMRCSKCWECPVCTSTLAMCVSAGAAAGAAQSHHLACGFCRWSSKGRLEAAQPDQLASKIIAMERDSEPRQRMGALVDALRASAQEQQKERELAQRLRRHSALRGWRVTGSAKPSRGRPAGPWRLEDLEGKLRDRAAAVLDLRAEASGDVLSAAASEGRAASAPPPSAAAGSVKDGAGVKDAPKRAQAMPGLSVEEVLQAHSGPLLDAMRSELEEGDAGATLEQRLRQISYGHQRTKEHCEGARPGAVQFEVPLQSTCVWETLPARRGLLTRRSRRCRLRPRDAAADDVCNQLVVKPQINPCSNPPFQKNNVALSFIARCAPWAWREVPTPGGVPFAELVFIVSNPLDTEIDVSFDPKKCNPSRRAAEHAPAASTLLGEEQSAFNGSEQNVEVLTEPFATSITRFNDLADVHEVWGEESEKIKSLREADDQDVVVDRKLHKILVRICFERPSVPSPLVFFIDMNLTWVDHSSREHRVSTVLRFVL